MSPTSGVPPKEWALPAPQKLRYKLSPELADGEHWTVVDTPEAVLAAVRDHLEEHKGVPVFGDHFEVGAYPVGATNRASGFRLVRERGLAMIAPGRRAGSWTEASRDLGRASRW